MAWHVAIINYPLVAKLNFQNTAYQYTACISQVIHNILKH